MSFKHRRQPFRRAVVYLLLVSLATMGNTGCSRRFWREQAEHDTYHAIGERLNDHRWRLPRVDIKPDRRSRFFDPYDPDCGPLPPDDPAAHKYMHCVNGMKGYKSWHELGTALSIENPHWLEPYGVLMQNSDPVHGHNQVALPEVTLNDAVELSYIHSREYQTAIENLYLDALSLTLQRFNFGVRYNGANLGGVPGIDFDYTDNPGIGDGDPHGFDANFGVSQLLPSGAQLAVELANNTLWLFGTGADSSATTLGYSLTQPLLRGAGRKIILEGLTQSERDVLYETRTLARFRQTFFTDTASDYLNILQQIQSILNLEGNIRRLQEQIEIREGVENYIPTRIGANLVAFPQDAQIPDSLQDHLSHDEQSGRLNLIWKGELPREIVDDLLSVSADTAYQAAAEDIISKKNAEVTPLAVLELYTRLNRQQNQLQDSQRRLADQLDSYKISLGLPPDVQLTIDDSLLLPFTLIAPELVNLEDRFKQLAKDRGESLIPETNLGEEELAIPELDELRSYVDNLIQLRDDLNESIDLVESDFLPIQNILESTTDDWSFSESGKRYFLGEEERERVINDVSRDLRLFRLIREDFQVTAKLADMLADLVAGNDDPAAVFKRLDSNNNQFIEPNELPELWDELPKIGSDAVEDEQPIVQPDEEPEGDAEEVPGMTYEEFIVEASRAINSLREDMLIVSQSMQVVQVGLRVEVIALNRFTLPGETEFPSLERVTEVALRERHDLMNAKAAVMDARRAMEIAANNLEATLDLEVRGSVGSSGTKPFNFDDDAASVNVGLSLDTPVDQVAERNIYNRAQIEYQRERRNYMQLEDQVKQQVRQSWRQLGVSEQRLEIDRQAVRIAALQYDNAALQATGAGQQNSLSLLNALDSVLSAQNSLVGDWITYEQNRLNIYRDMGIMDIDPRGVWTDSFYQNYDEQSSSPAMTPNGLITPDQISPEVPANE